MSATGFRIAGAQLSLYNEQLLRSALLLACSCTLINLTGSLFWI